MLAPYKTGKTPNFQARCEGDQIEQGAASIDSDDAFPGNLSTSDSEITTATAGATEEVVIDGTTYTIGLRTSTISINGTKVIIGPGTVVIGNKTVSIPATATIASAIYTEGVTIILEPIPTLSPTSTLAEVIVIGSSTYTLASETFTVSVDGTTLVVEPTDVIIGSHTLNFPATPTGSVVISTDGIEVIINPVSAPEPSSTLVPPDPTSKLTSEVSPTSTLSSSSCLSSNLSSISSLDPSSISRQTSRAGPTPVSTAAPSTQPAPASSATLSSAFSTPMPQAATTVVQTLTAINGQSTREVTYDITTLFPFLSLATTSTFTTFEVGQATVIVVGPYGVAWECSDCTSVSGFPPVTFPSLPPPSPGSTAPRGPQSTSSSFPFPSSQFPLPPLITTTITVSGPSGVIIVTETESSDTNGVLVPVSTLKPRAASSRASSLASEIKSVSGVVASFSRSPQNPTSASSAKAAVASAHDGELPYPSEMLRYAFETNRIFF